MKTDPYSSPVQNRIDAALIALSMIIFALLVFSSAHRTQHNQMQHRAAVIGQQ